MSDENHLLIEKLEKIEQAIADFHYALDNRQNYDVASNKAMNAIQDIMEQPWKRNEELTKRSKPIKEETE